MKKLDHKHDYETDTQARVNQCVHCGKIRYVLKERKINWDNIKSGDEL